MKKQKGYAVVSRGGAEGGLPAREGGWLARVVRWYQLSSQRRQLATMSDFALKDMGLSRADVLQEVEKPFWHDPMKRD